MYSRFSTGQEEEKEQRATTESYHNGGGLVSTSECSDANFPAISTHLSYQVLTYPITMSCRYFPAMYSSTHVVLTQ